MMPNQSPSWLTPALQHWIESAQPHWQHYTEHAFVKGLQTGTLATEAYVHYLKQDYVFLHHFAKAWALLVVKLDTLENMKLAAATVDGLLNHEMALHESTCEAHGIDLATLQQTPESTANLTYTRYVLATGQAGDALDLLAALAPCVFGYGQIGLNLGQTRTSNNPYQPWIDTYHGEEYQQVCNQVGQLMDQLIAQQLGDHPTEHPRWSKLCQIFTQATALEVDFWQMGLTKT